MPAATARSAFGLSSRSIGQTGWTLVRSDWIPSTRDCPRPNLNAVVVISTLEYGVGFGVGFWEKLFFSLEGDVLPLNYTRRAVEFIS